MTDEPNPTKKPVFYLPLNANVPVEWIRRKTIEGCTFVVPAWGTAGETEYEIDMDYATRQLKCHCKGFLRWGYCHHIRGLIWFTYKPAHRTGVQDTSLLAYRNFSEEDLQERESKVFEWLLKNGAHSNREIAEGLGWAINCVTGRMKTLRDKHGVVADYGKKLDTVTGQWVHVWIAIGKSSDEDTW